ncbi:MAG TPA: hypothetical protein VEK79_18295 [Thermoanaerobaculia bacterium]|nr:hypothetical protein [Thermoanaerobaculia bacterium]
MMLSGPETRRGAGTLLFLALVPTILFGDILFGSQTLFMRDVALYHYPGKRVLREIVLGGEFPYWSPYISAGQPVAANPVHQVFYPLTWLILLPDFTRAFNLLALIHVYLALFGMYALLRSMRTGRAAAAFGALSYGIGGVIVSMLNLFPLLYSAAWLPLTCLFTRRFLITRARRDFALAACALGMQLVIGEPVSALQTGIILGCYAIGRGWREGRRRGVVRAIGAVAMISIVALLLSSVQTLPALDHLRESGRGRGIDFNELTDWSMPPLRLAEPLFPAILGRWSMGQTPIWASLLLFDGHSQPLFFSIYSGLAVAVLALAALFARARGSALFASLTTISIALALGGNTPLFAALHETGMLRFIRFPEKFVVMGTFAAIVFAAYALQRVFDGDARIRRAALAVAATISLVAFALAAAAWLPAYEPVLRRLYEIDAQEPIFNMIAISQKEWLFAALRAALLFVLLRAVGRARRDAWIALFVAFVLVDLVPHVSPIAPRLPRSFVEEAPVTVRRFPPNRDAFRIFQFADWIRSARQGPRIDPADDLRIWELRNNLPAQLPSAFGLRTVIDIDIDASDLRAERDFCTSVVELTRKKDRPADWMHVVAAMSNVWFVGVYKRPEEIARIPRGVDRALVRFLELPHYQRYYFATELVTIRDRHEFVRALRSRRFSRQVAFVHEPAFAPAPGIVHAWRETANSARIDVEARGRAFLVMSVTPHKNWRITIDGQETSAVVANIGYQGVVVPPGRHLVEMRYRDPLVSAGAAMSAVALLALAPMLFSRRPPCPCTKRK